MVLTLTLSGVKNSFHLVNDPYHAIAIEEFIIDRKGRLWLKKCVEIIQIYSPTLALFAYGTLGKPTCGKLTHMILFASLRRPSLVSLSFAAPIIRWPMHGNLFLELVLQLWKWHCFIILLTPVSRCYIISCWTIQILINCLQQWQNEVCWCEKGKNMSAKILPQNTR